LSRFFALAVALALVFAAFAAPASADVKASQYTLSNGMQVVVISDHRAPVVTHMVWYRVGGVDDPMGLSGLAHFFEHLMFKGTKGVAGGELSKAVARNGGQDNAFTTHDYTAFFERIAKDKLPLVMGLEADRMTNLDLSDDHVRTERAVVMEERRSRIESNPSSQLQEQMMATLYLSHPYGRPVIGWMDEIAHIGRPEATDYYTHHYAPNNATLIVAGDVEPQEVLALAKEKYGALRRREIAPRSQAVLPPKRAEARLSMTHADVRLPVFMRMYRVPSYVTAAPGVAESLEVLAEVMGGGSASRLYQSLVAKQKLAVNVGAWYGGYSRDSGQFGIIAYPRPGVPLDRIEKAADAVIAAMQAAPPGDEEFSRAKTKLVADAVYSRDNQGTMANTYGVALSIGMTARDVEEWPQRVEGVKAGDVRAAALNSLRKTESVTGWLLPPKGKP
jgi:zinc protease